MENGFKFCRNVDCEQKQPVHISGFSKNKTSKDGLQTWCKKCMKKYKKNWLETEAKEAGQKAYKEGLITHEEIEDAISLFKSCRSRIHSCRYDIGIYKNIECHWDDPYQFLKDILTVKEENAYGFLGVKNVKLPIIDGKEVSYWNTLFEDWKAQRKIYLASGNEDDKPELDRIFGRNTPYAIGNIKCLSDYWNRENAKPITPLRIKLYKDDQLINERHFSEVEKTRRWIMSATGCKCSRNKILSNVDGEFAVLSDECSFKVHSLEYMEAEFKQEQEQERQKKKESAVV